MVNILRTPVVLTGVEGYACASPALRAPCWWRFVSVWRVWVLSLSTLRRPDTAYRLCVRRRPSVSEEETDAALSASDQGGNVASSTTDEEVCPPAPPTDPAAWASEDASFLVDINRATLDELIQLPGIGPAYAQRIIELRELRSGFVYKEELMDVSGIGPARFARLKDLITVGPYPGATDSAGEE